MANLITGAFRDRFALIGGRAPLQTFLLTLLVALLAVFDTFRYASVGIEDRLVRLLTVKANWQPQVMLVDDLPADSAGQHRVLQAMVSAGPALIVWMDDRGPVLPESAFAVPFLIAGEAATGEAPSPTGRRALLHVGSSEYGIHRYQELVAPPGNELGTMEATALAMLGRPVGEAVQKQTLLAVLPVRGRT